MTDQPPTPDLWALITSPEARNAASGAAGGIVRWLTLGGGFKAGSVSILVGSICAVYLGPLVAPLLEPIVGRLTPDGDARGFSAFVVGLGGITLSALLIDAIRARQVSIQKGAHHAAPIEPQPPVALLPAPATHHPPDRAERPAPDVQRPLALGDPEV